MNYKIFSILFSLSAVVSIILAATAKYTNARIIDLLALAVSAAGLWIVRKKGAK